MNKLENLYELRNTYKASLEYALARLPNDDLEETWRNSLVRMYANELEAVDRDIAVALGHNSREQTLTNITNDNWYTIIEEIVKHAAGPRPELVFAIPNFKIFLEKCYPNINVPIYDAAIYSKIFYQLDNETLKIAFCDGIVANMLESQSKDHFQFYDIGRDMCNEISENLVQLMLINITEENWKPILRDVINTAGYTGVKKLPDYETIAFRVSLDKDEPTPVKFHYSAVDIVSQDKYKTPIWCIIVEFIKSPNSIQISLYGYDSGTTINDFAISTSEIEYRMYEFEEKYS